MISAMAAMVMLTFMLGMYAFRLRVRSVKEGRVRARAYKLMEADFPDEIIKSTRSFNNQFEIPVVFYVGALLYIVTGHGESIVGITLAWLFVISRFVHAYIHITYNHLLHRLIAFWVAYTFVAAFWLNLLVLVYTA